MKVKLSVPVTKDLETSHAFATCPRMAPTGRANKKDRRLFQR